MGERYPQAARMSSEPSGLSGLAASPFRARFIAVFTSGVVAVFIGLPRPGGALTNYCRAVAGQATSAVGCRTKPRIRN